MPFSRPTLSRLISRAKSDIEAVLQNGASLLRRSFEAAIARSLAGLAHGLHGHIDWASRQIIIDTADDEFLVRWAEIWGQPRLPAEFAEFEITLGGFVGEVTIPEGTIYTRVDGVQFATTAEVTLPADPPFIAVVDVQALEEGDEGNTVPSSQLTIGTPIVGLLSTAVVNGSGSDPIGGGSDIETIDALRARLLAYIQTPPKGGALGDYVTWAKEASSSVTRAWELPLGLGPGTVLVLFVQDTFDGEGFFVDTLFPTGDQIDEVREYIDTKKPITANGYVAEDYVAAPLEEALDPTIQIDPNTADVQLQVTRQLQDLLLREAEPGGTLSVSKIREAISIATGEENHNLVSPVADVTTDATTLLTLGTVTFQDMP